VLKAASLNTVLGDRLRGTDHQYGVDEPDPREIQRVVMKHRHLLVSHCRRRLVELGESLRERLSNGSITL
jgi:hypothetical protein